jgi:hypothetical protein
MANAKKPLLLCQVIAIETDEKSKANRAETDAYHLIQKESKFYGQSRVYAPKEDEGEVLPPETVLLQATSENVIRYTRAALQKMFDVVATKEYANCEASADIVVEGNILLKDVPVTYILFLEKEVKRLKAFVSKLPVLDPSATWEYDANRGCFVTEPTTTYSKKRVKKVLVKAEATEKHPAQTEVYEEDVPVGTWTMVRFSGALKADTVKEFARRLDLLDTALKLAREEANSHPVERVEVGGKVLDYVFGG